MAEIPFGTGIFSESGAARLLRVKPRTIRRWWRGYKYRPQPGAPERERPPVGRTKRDLPVVSGKRDMSFLEFAEMVVVAAAVAKGVPLQRVRKFAETLMNEYDVDRPFAYKRVFTDGRDLFMGLSHEAGVPDLVKLLPNERLQIRAGKIDEMFVVELVFSDKGPTEFYPAGRDAPIVVRPDIAFGRPVVVGTRITTEAIASMVRGSSVEETARAYQLTDKIVLAAYQYEESLTRVA